MSVVTKDTIQPSSGQALTIKDEGGTASITIATNGEATFAENIKVTNGKGIDFSAISGSASGSSSAVLDDYEEGTFTPTVTSGTHGGLGANGAYTKIGQMVYVVIRLSDVNAGSGNAYASATEQRIGGLPFTASSSHATAGGLNTVYDIRIEWPAAGNQLRWRINGGNDYAIGHWFASTGTGSNTEQSQWTTSGASIFLTGSYIV